MPIKYDSNALWVAINDHLEGNLLHLYPRLLADLLLQEESERVEGDTSEAENLVLPSDKEWRLQKYFYLIELQESAESSKDVGSSEPSSQYAGSSESSSLGSEEWAPWNMVLPTKHPNAPPPVAVRTAPGPAWDIKKVLKAGRLLSKPPMDTNFEDEQEMRCVYSVIYDVFRYKSVLDQAIDDVDFFGEFPEHSSCRHIVWLFIMELACRRWAARPRGELDRINKLLADAGSPFKEIEQAVWTQRVHFAAAIARIRIKNKAFTLADLLPSHLREDRMSACVNKETVTGWVNTFKAKKMMSLVHSLHERGYTYSHSRQLCAGEYRFDRVCPRFITLRPPDGANIGSTDLFKNGMIVLQEREFCEGASTFCRALRVNSLSGVVAQTHASSPRSSAYLAAQLKELAVAAKAKSPRAVATPELGKLVVFGAGDKVESYVCALRELGVEASQLPASDAPVCVISDSVHCDTPAVIDALDGVVAALAIPPNSYSSVLDPIDLVCGQGGDLAMLETLTEADANFEGRKRAQSILEEQKKTLKTLLSKPQIQLILYETHSSLEAENQAQITRAVAEANRLARERHKLLRKKCPTPKTPKMHAEKKPESQLSMISITTSQSDSETEKDDIDMPFDGDSIQDPPQETAPSSLSATTELSVRGVLKKSPYSEPVDKRSDSKARPIPEIPVPDTDAVPQDPDLDSPDVQVPDCDLFEITKLPVLGNGLDINFILERDGCYLGLIQRKEITRIDAKFMINVAEERGLFAQAVPQAPRRKKPATADSPRRCRRKAASGRDKVERVAAPTIASMVRATERRRGSAQADGASECVCERHARRQAAASAYAATACTCDARHRMSVRRRRPGLPVDAPRPRPHTADPAAPLCRDPFPLAVHELQLYSYPFQFN